MTRPRPTHQERAVTDPPAAARHALPDRHATNVWSTDFPDVISSQHQDGPPHTWLRHISCVPNTARGYLVVDTSYLAEGAALLVLGHAVPFGPARAVRYRVYLRTSATTEQYLDTVPDLEDTVRLLINNHVRVGPPPHVPTAQDSLPRGPRPL